MASASSKKSLDTDYITLRRVFAKLSDNSQVPANYVLASYGDGRTYWAQPSTLGLQPTFNEIRVDSNQYIGSISSASLRFSGINGVVLSTTASPTSSLQFINTDYLYVDVSGATSLYAYSNFALNNALRVETTGFLSSGTIPSQNLLTIGSLEESPPLSTNIISFQSIKVISSLQSNTATNTAAGIVLSKVDSSSFVTLAGLQDFQFRTNFNPAVITLSLSSYNARDFLGISSLVATSYLSTFSTISSVYTQKDIYSTALISLSTNEYRLYSTNVSTMIELSNYTQTRYDQRFGETMARATIIQLNDQFGLLNSGMSTISSVKAPVYLMESTTKGIIDTYSTAITLSTSTFANFQAGSIFNFLVNGMYVVSTQLSTLSTSVGTSITNYGDSIRNLLQNYVVSTNSTVANLGTIGYISSGTLSSTIRELGTSGYISTPALVSTVSAIRTIFYVQSDFASTIQSTTGGIFARQPIISTLTLTSSLVSTTRGLEVEAAYTYISSAGLKEAITSTTQGKIGYLGNDGYISTPTLLSTYISSFGYGISSLYTLKDTLFSTLTSTTNSVISTNSLIYISVPSLVGYGSTLSNEGYVVRDQLESTVQGLLDKKGGDFRSTLTIPNDYTDGVNILSSNLWAIYNYADIEYGLYFSSVQYTNLGGYTARFNDTNYVTIEYTPNIFFTGFDQYQTNYASNYVSTLLQIGNTIYLDTLFHERFLFTTLSSNIYDPPNNVYSRKMMFQMKKDDFLQAEQNGFAIVHIASVYFVSDYTILPNSLYTSRQNSLFISIYN